MAERRWRAFPARRRSKAVVAWSREEQRMAARAFGRLYVVATPIGNLSDMTTRAVEVLRTVRVVACEDSRRGRALLARFGAAPEVVMSLHDHNEESASAAALAHLRDGRAVALIADAGTPLVSDPGFELVRSAWRAGIGVTPIPGASAVTAAVAASPIPVERFLFEGFLPAKPTARRAALTRLLRSEVAVVFFEAPHRFHATLAALADLGARARHLLVCRELTKRYETIRFATVAEHLEDGTIWRGELCCLLDPAAEAAASDADVVLTTLAAELPAAQAARLAAKITGASRASLYRRLQDALH